MNFAEIIKELRESHNLTQEELAHKLNVSRSTIAGYESRSRQPDFDKLIALSDLFHVSIDYLLTGKTHQEFSLPPQLNEKFLDKKAHRIYQHLSVENKLSVIKYMELMTNYDNRRTD